MATSMHMKTADFQNLWTRKIDMVFFEGWDEEPEQWSRIFNDLDGKGNNRTTQILAGQSRWKSKAELADPDEQRFKQGPIITTQFEPFAVDVTASREQVDDEAYDEIANMAKDAGRAGRETVEEECAEFLQSLFTGTIYDGKAAFAADHPNYGDIAGTQSNLANGELTPENLEAGIILFRKQKDEAGKKISSRPTKLVVPQSLQFVAARILESALVSGSTTNDKNVLPNLELVVNDYWDVHSQKAWILQGPRHQLNHIWRVMPEFKRQSLMNKNHSWTWKGYLRHACEVTNWRHMVGSTGVVTP